MNEFKRGYFFCPKCNYAPCVCYLQVNAQIPQGWICPQCQAVMGPNFPTCWYCRPTNAKSTGETEFNKLKQRLNQAEFDQKEQAEKKEK